MKPVVDRLKAEYEGRVEFRLYNVEESSEGQRLMQQYNAQYVPTFVFLNSDGTEAKRMVGETPEKNMRAILDSLK
jgi:thiol-disulfide isomerase/thioredoxin